MIGRAGDQPVHCPDDGCITDHVFQALEIVVVDPALGILKRRASTMVEALDRGIDWALQRL
ncbi:hypothetical protein PX554_06510 [Sphingomonas sp. H39-1-10]|uniref:hypothetical protein n=1 Tax=Sphingomonas pollutisoli TaxID=3030829 RepID=UPI0023B90D96|nr:hypothetical protein [Sphingomonas pollutisoli]MDF0487776.1 hypothetical protein [Sphingomonas pollutisoli]